MTEEIEQEEKDDSEKLIMVVDVTSSVLRNIRSSGQYANLSGHEVEYIAFISQQGTFVAEVLGMQKGVRLNVIYPNMDSKSKTTLYKVGGLKRHPMRRNSKIPRGRKRVIPYEEFMGAKVTGKIFRHHRDHYDKQ